MWAGKMTGNATAPAKAFPKLRKARKHLSAGKPVPLYPWAQVVTLGVTWYSFTPDTHVEASIKPAAGQQWEMLLRAHGQRYKGTRPTLEDAYKALDDLMFKVAKPYWLKQDAHAVIMPWGYAVPEAL
jgi:hypothetical protein